jgi:2'-5' RNA ligase
MIRLFIALLIPEHIRRQIVELREKTFLSYNIINWEPEEKLHLTLKFIGEVNEDLLNPVIDEIKFVENYKRFNCNLTKFGFFFFENKPKILWLGVNLNKEIFNLTESLNKKLEKFSITPDKKNFTPHLTLKRFKRHEEIKLINKNYEIIIPEVKFEATEIALIKSELMHSGSKYSNIKIYNLK